jgi:hypothetical protein
MEGVSLALRVSLSQMPMLEIFQRRNFQSLLTEKQASLEYETPSIFSFIFWLYVFQGIPLKDKKTM